MIMPLTIGVSFVFEAITNAIDLLGDQSLKNPMQCRWLGSFKPHTTTRARNMVSGAVVLVGQVNQ
jgi:hypothetical protein